MKEYFVRLKKEEILVLKQTVQDLSNDAQLFLFGSRVDNTKRGGDIDLLILSDSLNRKDLRKVRVEFFKHLGEQEFDIVLDTLSPKKHLQKLFYLKQKRYYD